MPRPRSEANLMVYSYQTSVVGRLSAQLIAELGHPRHVAFHLSNRKLEIWRCDENGYSRTVHYAKRNAQMNARGIPPGRWVFEDSIPCSKVMLRKLRKGKKKKKTHRRHHGVDKHCPGMYNVLKMDAEKPANSNSATNPNSRPNWDAHTGMPSGFCRSPRILPDGVRWARAGFLDLLPVRAHPHFFTSEVKR